MINGELEGKQKGCGMYVSHAVFSDDWFFKIGINTLLSPGLIEDNYFIFDIENSDHQLIRKKLSSGKKVIIFISNDVEYYALNHLEGVGFIDKRSRINEILACLIVNDARYFYQIKYQLSLREHQVLSLLLSGASPGAICRRLGVNIKTFYTHRLNLIKKLRLGNRVALYSNIARAESYRTTM